MIFSLFKAKQNKKTKANIKGKKAKSSFKKSTKKQAKVKTKAKRAVQKKKKKEVELIGEITHYFPKVKAAVIKIKKAPISLGDSIYIKGHTTDFKQKIVSMQLDHKPIKKASKGKEVGLRVRRRVRINDMVYKIVKQ